LLLFFGFFKKTKRDVKEGKLRLLCWQ